MFGFRKKKKPVDQPKQAVEPVESLEIIEGLEIIRPPEGIRSTRDRGKAVPRPETAPSTPAEAPPKAPAAETPAPVVTPPAAPVIEPVARQQEPAKAPAIEPAARQQEPARTPVIEPAVPGVETQTPRPTTAPATTAPPVALKTVPGIKPEPSPPVMPTGLPKTPDPASPGMETHKRAEAEKGEKADTGEETSKSGLFSRLRKGLSKTSSTLTEGMAGLVLGKKIIDDELLEELETRLLMADVGIEATETILEGLTRRVARKELKDAEALVKALEGAMVDVLKPVQKPLVIDAGKKPYVILVLGINGAGKTTTIGKLTHHLRRQGKSVMLAAGDTFRAAAVEQLQTWGERNQATVISQGQGADSASVIFDAWQAAKARGMDVLIADTAGRLHTQSNLMDELKKVKRVIQRQAPDAPHEVLLVVDAGTGQNALNQAREFHQAMDLTGIAVTKLDGTAKGGILFAIAERLGVPVRFIGVGEKIEDLREFDAEDFARALLSDRD